MPDTVAAEVGLSILGEGTTSWNRTLVVVLHFTVLGTLYLCKVLGENCLVQRLYCNGDKEYPKSAANCTPRIAA